MDSSSVCEKTWIEVVVKNLRNSFKNTLDKLSFELEIFALKLVEKTSEIDGKN